jgi:outer membrane protein assembly factor BamB
MTTDDRDREAFDQLRRFWDGVVEGRSTPPEGVDPHLLDTIRHLHSLGKATPEPDPSFIKRLKEELMNPHSFAVPLTLPASFAPTDGRAVPPPRRLRISRFPQNSRSWVFAQLATAALLLVTLGGIVVSFDLLRHGGTPNFEDVATSRGGAARTGEQPGPGPRHAPVTRWSFATGGRLVASPSLADGVVYAGADDGVLYAVDAATGKERWRFASGSAIGAAPAIADGTIYIGNKAGQLLALDAATGAVRWQTTVTLSTAESAIANSSGSLQSSSPVVMDGVVYVVSGGGATSPAVVDGVVYASGDASPGGSFVPKVLRAYDARSGAERWRFPKTSPIPENGLYAVDAATGLQRWFLATPNTPATTPAVAGGLVYVASKDGTLVAADTATGQERWRFKAGGAVYSSPSVADGTVYLGSTDKNLYALDAITGQERWHTAIGAIKNSSPTVADGVIYVLANGVLHAVSAADGAERWQVEVGKGADSSPVVSGGLVFVGGPLATGGANLLALGDPG